jgi:signal transduction histidine kinase
MNLLTTDQIYKDELSVRERLAALTTDISIALIQYRSLREMLQVCAEVLVKYLDGAFARIWTLNEKENLLELQASAGMYTHIDGGHARVPVGQFKIGRIAKEREPHLTNSVTEDPQVSDQEWARREGMVAFAGYPLIIEDRLVGVMAMFSRNVITEIVIQAMAAVSNGIALGIEHKRTEEKIRRSEEELRRLNTELEKRVEERTQMLLETNKELESFSYSVSHDLRAPLRHISGFVELLQKNNASSLDEKGQRYLNVIADSAKRAGQLVDDLLAFSRMGRMEMKFVDVDMNVLVKEVKQEKSQINRDKNIEWAIHSLPMVQGDPTVLRQVVFNLFSNGIKYSRKNDLIKIEMGYTSNEKEHIFYVKDNGVGFDMSYVDKLFGVFQRLHRPEEFDGTGIGLANVKRIIDRHGGRVWADGAIGKGATFYFSLPKLGGKN